MTFLSWPNSNNTRTVIDYVNAAENTIFVQNVTQMVSQIMDNLIYSSGGILPMLSSATSRSVSLLLISFAFPSRGGQEGEPILKKFQFWGSS